MTKTNNPKGLFVIYGGGGGGGAVFRVGGGVKFSKPREMGGVFFFNTVELRGVNF